MTNKVCDSQFRYNILVYAQTWPVLILQPLEKKLQVIDNIDYEIGEVFH